MFDVRSKKNVFHVSKQTIQKQREVKKETTLRKKLTLNSQRISPLEKDTIISSFFMCFMGGPFLSFFSPTQGGLSHPNTHHRHPISFSLSLSFFLSFNIQIYTSENNNNAPPNPPHLRARIHVARAPLTARVMLRLKERKRNTQQNWIPKDKR